MRRIFALGSRAALLVVLSQLCGLAMPPLSITQPVRRTFTSAIHRTVRPTSSRGFSVSISSEEQPAIHCGKPPRPCRQQSCGRVCRQGRARQLHHFAGEPSKRSQRHALQTSYSVFLRDLEPVAELSRCQRDGIQSRICSGKDGRQIYRIRQRKPNPLKSTWHRQAAAHRCISVVFTLAMADRGENAARAL